MYYGEKDGVSTGASGDLRQASKTAYAMICKLGMDSGFGLCALDEQQSVSAEVRTRINAILDQEMARAIDTLRAHRDILDRLVEKLMQKNKLSEQEISNIIEGRTF